MESCLIKLEQLTGKESASIKAHLKDNASSAIKIACKFGAHDASQFIQTDQPIVAPPPSSRRE